MAWISLKFEPSLPDAARIMIAQIPGVRFKGSWSSCSDHALSIVRAMATSLGHSVTAWSRPIPSPTITRIPLLREWVPKFMVPYQQEGVAHALTAWHNSNQSGMFVWAAGCLAGDTRITINRGGAAKEIAIATLFHKFNGGKSFGRAWDLSIPTMAQSAVDGFVRLNVIESVVYSGRKTTHEITTTSGKMIRATSDHRFLRPDGSFSHLDEMRVGNEVITTDWPTANDEASEKAQYEQIDHMWNHPFHVYAVIGRSNRPGARRTARVATHRLIAEAEENGMSLFEFVGRIVLGQIDGLTFLDPDQFHVHHVNGNHRDNRIENLEVMRCEDHTAHHGRERAWKHVSGFTVSESITCIKSIGEEDTFDISMQGPHHNFIANDFVVHNSGKTLGSQAWACAAGEKMKTIVVTKSAVRFQWRDEAERFTEASAIVIDGQTPSALPERGFVICGYDVLPFWAREIERWRPDSVIFDESHKVKNRKRWDAIVAKSSGPIITRGGDLFAEDSKVIASIEPATSEMTFHLKGNQAAAAFIVSRAAKRRLATTATPIRDRVRDLWAQLDLVRPAEFGSFFGKFGERSGFAFRYCGAHEGTFGGIDDSGMSNPEELRDRLRYVAHYVPFSLANRELPPKRRRVALVRVAEQNRPGAIAADIKRAAQSGQRSAMIEARLWEAASRKRKRIGDLVAQAIENGQKVIIFTGRRRDCDELEEEIASRWNGATDTNGDDRIWTAHGGHSDSIRRRIQKDYMAIAGPAVLIGTSEAWGEGLDLQDTDLLLVAMLPYTPGQVIQIEGRVARLGQRRPVEIVYLISEATIDEHVAQILLRKLPAVEKATDTEEVRGIAHELAGADDETLIAELAASIGAAV